MVGRLCAELPNRMAKPKCRFDPPLYQSLELEVTSQELLHVNSCRNGERG